MTDECNKVWLMSGSVWEMQTVQAFACIFLILTFHIHLIILLVIIAAGNTVMLFQILMGLTL